jgi:hypothetical protein
MHITTDVVSSNLDQGEGHFQQYFSYIMEVSFIGGENHPPVASP